MKTIQELNQEERRALIENNHALETLVYEDMEETEMYFISEQLDYIRAACRDWSIGAYQRNYIQVRDALAFLDGLEDMQKAYCTLPDHMKTEIDRVLSARDRFRSMDMAYGNYYKLSEWLDEKAQYFADQIADYFTSCLDFDHASMVEYFMEFYADERMDESFFISNDGTLYQTITKKIS